MASEKWLAEWQQKIFELLRAKGAADEACPSCNKNGHYALPFITAQWADPPGKPFNKDGLFLVPLVCKSCAHVRFFFAGGLVSDPATTSEESGG